MNKRHWIIPLLCIAPTLITPVLAVESQSEAEYAAAVLDRDTKKAATKTITGLLAYIHRLNDPELEKKAAEEISNSLMAMEHNLDAMQRFSASIKRMAESGELKQLVSQKRVKAFAQTVMDNSSSTLKGLGEESLRKIIGLAQDGADAAGRSTLTILNQVEQEITQTGKLSGQLADKLSAAIKNLPPNRAQAARKLLAEKFSSDWKQAAGDGLNTTLGTVVDGAFVLSDAYDIAFGDASAEEKAAKATGTAVGYGMETSGGLAIQALGGGFLHGLVLSWSAGKVNELVAEIILLQQDRANAAEKERWADIELRMDVIRGMIRVDELIKAGELQKASNYLAKVQQFYFKHQMPGDGLYEKMQELEHNIDNAGRLQQANAIIAEARIPYMAGFQWVRQGRNLTQALTYVEDARQILKQSLRDYPELKTTLEKVEALQAFINKLINNASPLGKLAVDGPDTVKAGAHETYEISVSGGIPDYITTNIEGLALPTGALAYWQAPDEPGKTTVTFKIKDNIGQTASVEKQITVIGDVPVATITAAYNSCETSRFHAKIDTDEFSFILLTPDEVYIEAEKSIGKSLTQEQRNKIIDGRKGDFTRNTSYYQSIMPPSCFKLVSNQKLMIIWDGEYIDHTNGKRKYYVRGYQQKPTEKSDEKKLDKTKEEENLKEGWKKAMKKADSIWEKEAEKEREYIKKRRQENK